MSTANLPWTAEVRIDLETAILLITRQFPALLPLEAELKGDDIPPREPQRGWKVSGIIWKLFSIKC